MSKVLIVDDHVLVRHGLVKILREDPSISKVGEASTGSEGLSKLRDEKWDIAILDISLPDNSGLVILSHVKELFPNLPVLILSMHPEERYAVRAIESGASGYLTKNVQPEELLRAVKRLINGQKYITSSLGEILASKLEQNSDEKPHQTLSKREYQVFIMIASGKTVNEISSKLYLSSKTVRTYRSRVLKKMKLERNSELIYYAFKHKLID